MRQAAHDAAVQGRRYVDMREAPRSSLMFRTAKLLCEIGPVERFRSDAQLARHAGVAPLDASSGKHQRHRLDRGGNRQLNCALHRIAITQGRVHAPARAYLERKQNEGKNRREAIRCLKRQLARTIYSTLRAESALT